MLRNSPPGACLIRLLRLGLLATLLASCGTKSPDLPRPGPTPTPTPRPGTTLPPPQVVTPIPTITRAATPSPPAGTSLTLADFWDGHAHFVLQEQYTGLPMGESDTIALSNGELWSYMHSSSQHPAGTIDQCGNPVPFPGCTVIYRSSDGGYRFQHANPPVCQFTCQQCPCNSENDHIEQQQYPRVHYDAATQTLYLVYEYLGRTMLRTSGDGLNWSRPERVAQTGIWKTWLMPCPAAEHIGQHPFVPYDYECLAGGPPGIYVADGLVYVFVAVGQSPAGMGCYVGRTGQPPGEFQRCASNPLFRGAAEYGPLDLTGRAANPYFDFRTISAAEIIRLGKGDEARYYMLYEGLRGPGPGDNGDTQFGLGLARSLTNQIDGPWETYPGNPILADLPGNVGLGHADLVVYNGQTILYTSLDGVFRSRLLLVGTP